jgi:hypothetical protein
MLQIELFALITESVLFKLRKIRTDMIGANQFPLCIPLVAIVYDCQLLSYLSRPKTIVRSPFLSSAYIKTKSFQDRQMRSLAQVKLRGYVPTKSPTRVRVQMELLRQLPVYIYHLYICMCVRNRFVPKVSRNTPPSAACGYWQLVERDRVARTHEASQAAPYTRQTH